MHHPLAKTDSIEEIIKYPLPIINRDENRNYSTNGHPTPTRPRCHVHDADDNMGTSWFLRSMEDLIMDMLTEDEKLQFFWIKFLIIRYPAPPYRQCRRRYPIPRR
jgi:hypothetical protein